jgi:hypothetical protein
MMKKTALIPTQVLMTASLFFQEKEHNTLQIKEKGS